MSLDEMSTRDAAVIIGVPIYVVRDLIHAGELNGWRLTDAGWFRISRRSVLAFVKRLKQIEQSSDPRMC